MPDPTAAPRSCALVERVQDAIDRAPDAIDKARPDYDTAMARAAIREVARWLLEQDPEPGVVGRMLGQISTPCGVMADQLMHQANR